MRNNKLDFNVSTISNLAKLTIQDTLTEGNNRLLQGIERSEQGVHLAKALIFGPILEIE